MPPGEDGGLDDLEAQLRQPGDGDRERQARGVSGSEFLNHFPKRGRVENGAPGPPWSARDHKGRATRIEPGADQLVCLDA